MNGWLDSNFFSVLVINESNTLLAPKVSIFFKFYSYFLVNKFRIRLFASEQIIQNIYNIIFISIIMKFKFSYYLELD